MINRKISNKIKQLATKFPVITVTGPRQSGKSTLVKKLFSKLPYATLEDPDVRLLATNDPRGFLNNYPKGAILDEVQHVPQLFSYIQGIVDEKNKAGMFVLSGSQNFLLMENITQSLAGRTAICQLLPLSKSELQKAKIPTKDINELIYTGFYPRIYDKQIDPHDFYSGYVRTYLERDVRQIKNITDHSLFVKFLKMCAARVGSVLNLHSLANDCGISPNTAKAWLSILETGFIIHLLQPYHNNFSKRLMKSPKIYFYDTGLVCYLLGLDKADQVATHFLRGGLFENLVIADALKHYYNIGKQSPLYYWKDKTHKEIDIIIDKGNRKAIPIEIKSGETRTNDYFANFAYWNKVSDVKIPTNSVIYAGAKKVTTSAGTFVPFATYESLLK
ncbi:MAG: ATP-binding protein [Bacteroidota bacterium]|nr:ATP-binding protein [Bacteroidota bacterium]